MIVQQHTTSERILGTSTDSMNETRPDEEILIDRRPVFMINPSIESLSDETIVMEEGCLSVPFNYMQQTFGPNTRVERPNGLCITYVDERGQEQSLCEDGSSGEHSMWFVRCALHEFDHLQGVLFTDKLYQQGA